MFDAYLKHRFKSFKSSLFVSFLIFLLSLLVISFNAYWVSLFQGGIFMYYVLLTATLIICVSSATGVVFSFFYILMGDGIKRNAFGDFVFEWYNIFNWVISKLFPENFAKSVEYLKK